MLNPRDIENVEINNRNVIDVENISQMEIPIYYDLEDPKDYRKYISNIKKIIRNSIEYKDLVSFIKDNYFNNKSGIFSTDIDIKTELHHIPFTLEDIIELVYIKNKEEGLSNDIIDISEEVMILHYDGLIGLYNLSETEHTMIHNNTLFVPLSSLYGNVKMFFETFKKYMTEYQIEVFEEYERKSIEVIKSNKIFNKEYFDINYLNTNHNNVKKLNYINNNLNDYNDKYNNI